MSKKLGKYIGAFNYFVKALIALSAAFGGVFIISFASAIGIPAGITTASFTLEFSLTRGIIKILLEVARYKKKKHNEVLCLLKVY